MRLTAVFILIIFLLVPASAQWCGITTIFFEPQNQTVGSDTYHTWINYPTADNETTKIVTLRNTDGYKLVQSFLSPPGTPDISNIYEGVRSYHSFGYVSSNPGNTRLMYEPFTLSESGTKSVLYQLETADINTLVEPAEINTVYASTTDLVINPTDRLGCNVYAVTDHPADVDVYFVYGGITNTSHVESGFFDCAQPTPEPTIPDLPAEPLVNKWEPSWSSALAAIIIIILLLWWVLS